MWRYWCAVVGWSLFLHLLVFWPSPAARLSEPNHGALSVRFVENDSRVGKQSELADGAVERPSEAGRERGAIARREVVAAQEVRALPAVRPRSRGGHDPISLISSDSSPVGEGVEGERGGLVEAVGAYRMALAVVAVRLQHFSRLEGAPALVGRAVVGVRFGVGGAQPDVKLESSSGIAGLDQQAVALIKRALRQVEPPRGQAFSITLPVLFDAVED